MLLFCDSIVFIALAFTIAANGSVRYSWATDIDPKAYQQALDIIENHSMVSYRMPPNKGISLKEHLKSIDSYSAFLTSSEYEAFKVSQRNTYAGVGMDIENDGKGNIICFPFPGSASAQAGIKSGDILQKIDEITVTEKSLLEIVPLIRGEVNTRVALTVMGSSGKLRSIKITRRNVRDNSVRLYYYGNTPIISIQTFRPETSRELRFAVERLEDRPAVIIDLRGNGGGDFHAAMDASILFLKKGAKIVEVQTRKKNKPYLSSNGDQYPDKLIYLLQDDQTASAAEVFIAALTENGRVASFGKRTFGKGTVQEIFELSDGSAIFLTTGYLLTPSGIRYDGKGINPTYAIDQPSVSTDACLEKIKTLSYPLVSSPKKLLKNNKMPVPDTQPDVPKPKEVKSDPEGVNVGVPDNNAMPIEKEYFVCLDKEFHSNMEAETWYNLKIKNKLPFEPCYVLQKSTAKGVKHVVCFESIENQPLMKEKLKNLMDAMGLNSFILKVPAK